MDRPIRDIEQHNGLGDPGAIRYGAICVGAIAWLVLGVVLYTKAQWPSTCIPGNIVELYACSSRLPESGRWIESAMLTWLWSSPLLVALEILRRVKIHEPEVEP